MREVIKTALGLTAIGAALILFMAAKPVAKYPEAWIPMFFGAGDEVSTLINTTQITRITPMFDAEKMLSHNEKKASYLEVQMSNGEKLEVFEPFDEFVERIRRSQ